MAGICCTSALHGFCRDFCAAQLSVCRNAVQHPFIMGSDDFDERFFFAVSALQGKHCSYISFMVAGAVDCIVATWAPEQVSGAYLFFSIINIVNRKINNA
ncbi:MAG: hypothetical protein PUJ02_01525 [Anaerovibrio sp.]|nr:hypothetical protein [Anaerovibrio sp.]